MLRFAVLAVLMAFGSPAWAGDSISFVVGGHRIYLEAPGRCRSASCLSVSIPGIYEKRARRERVEDSEEASPAPARSNAPAPQPLPVTPPASPPPVQAQPAICPPPPVFKPAATVTQEAAAPSLPAMQPPRPIAVTAPSPPVETTPPTPSLAPRIATVSHEIEEPADTPLGDWHTEGKGGTVRIERCGNALCGYVLDAASNAKGETVLVNMKPGASSRKPASEWSGNIYSHDSGITYYGTIVLRGPNSLRVEACALGRFFCSGNAWSRVPGRERLISSTQSSPPPRS